MFVRAINTNDIIPIMIDDVSAATLSERLQNILAAMDKHRAEKKITLNAQVIASCKRLERPTWTWQ